MHSSPSSAHAVAVATPCWPAPVSAMIRCLPMRLASRRLAERVVDLVRAGVEQVLALEVDLVAGGLRQPLGVVERGRAAGEVAQQRAQLGAEALVVARLEPRGLELGERRHQRLGDVLAAVGPEAVLDRGRDARCASEFAVRAAVPAAATNASTFAGSLMPGSASTPDATSTPHGRTAAIAVGDVLGRQPAGQDAPAPASGAARPAASPRCGRCRRAPCRAGASRCGSARCRACRRPTRCRAP